MIALITGGAKGIGASIANILINKGYLVYINYLTSDKEALELQNKLGHNLIISKGDITNELYINKLFEEIKSKGELALIINNAAYTNDLLYQDLTKDIFMRTLEVNLVAPFIITKKYSMTFNKGKVINICSTDGIDTFNEWNINYASSKAGLINLTKSMALSIKNLTIYGLIPNFINTEIVREMDQDYLKEELKRINQLELIELDTINKVIIRLIENDYPSGYLERIDNNE